MLESLLKVEENDKLFVRKLYDTNEEDLKRDIEILKEWLKKQPHLPQGVQNDNFLEIFLVSNKCRVEKAKQKIDCYYTLKSIRKELYVNLENIVPSNLVVTFLPLPIFTEAKERIFVIKLINKDPAFYDFVEAIRTSLALCELILRYDYFSGVRLIYDYEGISINHFKKMNLSDALKYVQVIQGAFSVRVRSIEFINLSSIMAVIMNFCKMVLPSKLYDKIRVHENLESLLKVIPKEILPKDYNGSLPTVEELSKQWDPVFEEHRQFFIDLRQHTTNENLRIGPCKYSEDIFGIEGTFKKINID